MIAIIFWTLGHIVFHFIDFHILPIGSSVSSLSFISFVFLSQGILNSWFLRVSWSSYTLLETGLEFPQSLYSFVSPDCPHRFSVTIHWADYHLPFVTTILHSFLSIAFIHSFIHSLLRLHDSFHSIHFFALLIVSNSWADLDQGPSHYLILVSHSQQSTSIVSLLLASHHA